MSRLVTLLLAAQAASGLIWREQYRDVDWIRLTWLGNDIVTLVAVVPLLLWVLPVRSATSPRRSLLLAGALAYSIYNSAFYLLGARLNVFFPLYVLLLLVSAITLAGLLMRLDSEGIALSFAPKTPARSVGAGLILVGGGLAGAWLGLWAAHIFAGVPTPVELDAFRLVAALDLTLLVPAFIAGGALLARRRPWGFVIATIASVQGALYLLVLSLNSFIAVYAGQAQAPGELLVWIPLALLTSSMAGILLAHARPGMTNQPI